MFVGRNDGRLTALDKANGSALGVHDRRRREHAPSRTFEHKGKQYVVVHAGGGVFAGAKRGDGIWMFSLTGTMKSLPAGGRGRRRRAPVAPAGLGRTPAPAADRPSTSTTAVSSTPKPASRATARAATAATAAARARRGAAADTILAVREGGQQPMPAFGRVYSDADLKDVAGYIIDVLAKKK